MQLNLCGPHLMVQVVQTIGGDVKGLFADRQRWLDRRILPAVHKLTWLTSKPTTDYFFREACTYCDQAQAASYPRHLYL